MLSAILMELEWRSHPETQDQLPNFPCFPIPKFRLKTQAPGCGKSSIKPWNHYDDYAGNTHFR